MSYTEIIDIVKFSTNSIFVADRCMRLSVVRMYIHAHTREPQTQAEDQIGWHLME